MPVEWTDKIESRYERGLLTFQMRGYAFERLEDFGKLLPKVPRNLEGHELVAAVLKALGTLYRGEAPSTPEFKAVVDQHYGYHQRGMSEISETPLDDMAGGIRLANGDYAEAATIHVRELILHTENAMPKPAREED